MGIVSGAPEKSIVWHGMTRETSRSGAIDDRRPDRTLDRQARIPKKVSDAVARAQDPPEAIDASIQGVVDGRQTGLTAAPGSSTDTVRAAALPRRGIFPNCTAGNASTRAAPPGAGNPRPTRSPPDQAEARRAPPVLRPDRPSFGLAIARLASGQSRLAIAEVISLKRLMVR